MVEIRIHQTYPQLDDLLVLNRCTTCAFITAWNPNGKTPHQLEQNIENNSVLLEQIHQSGWIALPAWGIPDVPIWPPEASFLILGISKKDAERISQQFNQHAFVFCAYGQKAKLCHVSNELNDNFYATTYSSAPLNLQHGQSLEVWLHCLQARRVEFSKYPRQDCIFQHVYHAGYLCWMKE